MLGLLFPDLLAGYRTVGGYLEARSLKCFRFVRSFTCGFVEERIRNFYFMDRTSAITGRVIDGYAGVFKGRMATAFSRYVAAYYRYRVSEYAQ